MSRPRSQPANPHVEAASAAVAARAEHLIAELAATASAQSAEEARRLCDELGVPRQDAEAAVYALVVEAIRRGVDDALYPHGRRLIDAARTAPDPATGRGSALRAQKSVGALAGLSATAVTYAFGRSRDPRPPRKTPPKSTHQ